MSQSIQITAVINFNIDDVATWLEDAFLGNKDIVIVDDKGLSKIPLKPGEKPYINFAKELFKNGLVIRETGTNQTTELTIKAIKSVLLASSLSVLASLYDNDTSNEGFYLIQEALWGEYRYY